MGKLPGTNDAMVYLLAAFLAGLLSMQSLGDYSIVYAYHKTATKVTFKEQLKCGNKRIIHINNPESIQPSAYDYCLYQKKT